MERDFIRDFLDVEDSMRSDGDYYFYTYESEYLNDIPPDFFHKVIKNPSEHGPGIVAIYFKDWKVGDVFSMTKASVPTYVSRSYDDKGYSEATYEAILDNSKANPGQTLVLYGPSKLGKSALWKRVFGNGHILVQCTNRQTLSDIYKTIIEISQKPFLAKSIESDETNENDGIEATLQTGTNILGGKISASKKKGKQKKITKESVYIESNYSAQSICNILKSNPDPIVFENYHRLDKKVLSDLCIDLRTFADENITTLFVGIPNNPYEFIEYNSELSGRIIFLELNPWSDEDLAKIILGGQRILNISFSIETIKFLCIESGGSPILMQLYALIACLATNITNTVRDAINIKLDKNKFKIAVERYAVTYLKPCEQIWKNFLLILKENNEELLIFSEKLIEGVKTNHPKLTFSGNDFTEENIDLSTIENIIQVLNKNESTKDILLYNSSKNLLSVVNPLIISYLRWIYK